MVRPPTQLRGDQVLTPFHHQLLAATYYGLRAAKAIGRPLGLTSADQLRVLIYHDIAPHDYRRFEEQLRWLSGSWNFVLPERFAAMISQREPIRGRHLLLTFDDGLASNRLIAEAVLNPLGIRALFFAVTDFVDLDNRTTAREFIAGRILPGSRIDTMPAYWTNMGWTDLECLLEQGHSIGAHTGSHARLSQLDADADLSHEIVASADRLESRLGVPIEHFAFPFGDIDSFSERALTIASRRFRFIYSGLRGDNAGVSPFALRRDGSSMLDGFCRYDVFGNHLLGAFLEGGADFRYSPLRDRLDAWCLACQ